MLQLLSWLLLLLGWQLRDARPLARLQVEGLSARTWGPVGHRARRSNKVHLAVVSAAHRSVCVHHSHHHGQIASHSKAELESLFFKPHGKSGNQSFHEMVIKAHCKLTPKARSIAFNRRGPSRHVLAHFVEQGEFISPSTACLGKNAEEEADLCRQREN